MPRLTNPSYLHHRQELIVLWQASGGGAFAQIPTSAQRDLHYYFALTAYMTDGGAGKHRVAVTKTFPSLPAKAGRAHAALLSARNNAANRVVRDHLARQTNPPPVGGKQQSLRVLPVARPAVDVDRLARALLMLATDAKVAPAIDKQVARTRRRRM